MKTWSIESPSGSPRPPRDGDLAARRHCHWHRVAGRRIKAARTPTPGYRGVTADGIDRPRRLRGQATTSPRTSSRAPRELEDPRNRRRPTGETRSRGTVARPAPANVCAFRSLASSSCGRASWRRRPMQRAMQSQRPALPTCNDVPAFGCGSHGVTQMKLSVPRAAWVEPGRLRTGPWLAPASRRCGHCSTWNVVQLGVGRTSRTVLADDEDRISGYRQPAVDPRCCPLLVSCGARPLRRRCQAQSSSSRRDAPASRERRTPPVAPSHGHAS